MNYPDDQGNPNGAIPVYQTGYHPANISTATGTLVKTGPGTFGGMTINTGAAGETVTVYDGVDNTGTVIGVYSAANPVPLPAAFALQTGLYIVTSGTANITIAYR